MKQNDRQTIVMAAVVSVVFVGLMSLVSNADYNHTVVGSMSMETYDSVLTELSEAGNDSPSEAEIVEWYEEHHR